MGFPTAAHGGGGPRNCVVGTFRLRPGGGRRNGWMAIRQKRTTRLLIKNDTSLFTCVDFVVRLVQLASFPRVSIDLSSVFSPLHQQPHKLSLSLRIRVLRLPRQRHQARHRLLFPLPTLIRTQPRSLRRRQDCRLRLLVGLAVASHGRRLDQGLCVD